MFELPQVLRRITVFVFAPLAALLLTGPAYAGFTIHPDAEFSVFVTADENVDVTCNAGTVQVSVNGTPNVTATPCSSVTSLALIASGAFANTLNASPVSATDFTALSVVTLDGGDGDDTLFGSPLDDHIFAGSGNDTLTGGRGNDLLFGDDGNDTFPWNPGEGSDTIEGDAGSDRLAFAGSAANEHVDVSANGSRLRLARDVASITMDVNGVETVELTTVGGADTVIVHDLTGVQALTALSIDAGDGDNVVDASAQNNPAVALTITGGADSDDLEGSPFADVIHGGDSTDQLAGNGGNDTLVGGPGDDVLLGNAGDDTFLWAPGDGSDFIEGQEDTDTLAFAGSNANELFEMSANGTRLRLSRDVGGITMDCGGLEVVNLTMAGGSDRVVLHDLTGIGGLQAVSIDGGDGPDTIDAGAQASSAVTLSLSGGAAADAITGSPNADRILGGGDDDTIDARAGSDTVVWNPGDGSDTVDAGDGTDALEVHGSADAEAIAIAAAPGGFSLTRDVEGVALSVVGAESLVLTALDAADRVTTVPLAATAQTLDGGAGEDALTVASGAACTTPVPGTISLAGGQPITFAAFENLVLPTACAPVVSVPTLGGTSLAVLGLLLLLLGSKTLGRRA